MGNELLTPSDKRIAEVKTPEEALKLEAIVDTVITYMKREGFSNGEINKAMRKSIDIARIGGRKIAGIERETPKGNQGYIYHLDKYKTELSELRNSIGIPRMQRWQAIAGISDKRYSEIWEEFPVDSASERLATKTRFISEGQKIKTGIKKQAKPLSDKYEVVILDPPWAIKKISRSQERPNQAEIDYSTMTVNEIIEFIQKEIVEYTEEHCHWFIWTTQKYLPKTFEIIEALNIRYVCTFVWHKPGGFQPVNLPQYNCEFVLYARQGTPKFIDTKDFNTCFSANRSGHSKKPDIFYEMIHRVVGGKKLAYFERKDRSGFDVRGDEI